MSTWGTTESMPFTADVLAAATAAGCAQIVELPCGSYVAGFNADPAQTVPQTVTMYQLEMAMENAGYYTPMMTYIAAQPAAVQIAFNRTQNAMRTNALIIAGATALGLTSEQIDALFTEAALLPPNP